MKRIYVILTIVFLLGYLPAQAQWTRLATAYSGTVLADQPHALQFINKDTGYVFVNRSLKWTADSGHTWKDISPVLTPGSAIALMRWPAANRGYIVVDDTIAGHYIILKTTNNGVSWDSLPISLRDTGSYNVADMAFSDTLHGYISGSNTLYKTIDGGSVWQAVQVNNFTFTYVRRIVMVDSQNVWLCGYFANGVGSERIVHTLNNGVVWDTTLVNPSAAYIEDIHVYAPDTLLAVTYSGGVYTSYNGGKSWPYSFNTVPSVTEYNFSIPDAAHCYLFTTNYLYESNDKGLTFHQQTLPAIYNDFQGAFTDSVTGYTLALIANGVDTAWHIYKTYNAGNCATVIFPNDLHVCKNVTFPLNYYLNVRNPDFTSYNWTPTTGLNNPHSAHPIDTALNNITYTLTITYDGASSPTCPNYITDSIKIYPANCDSVWPGDANADLVVDQNDVLYIGLAYGATGPVRADTGIIFRADAASNWSDSFQYGVNYKHADCNGNGVINADDTLAVFTNFSKVHSANRLIQPTVNSSLPTLHLRFNTDTAYYNQRVTLTASFGDAAKPVDSIYGMALAIQLDPTLVDTNALSTNFSSNFFTTASTNRLRMVKYDRKNGIMYACVTRINHTNHTNDTGDVCFTDVVVIDNLSGILRKLNPHILSYSFITASGLNILSNLISDTLVILPSYPKGVQDINTAAASIHVYPTLNDGHFTLQYHAPITRPVSIQVTDVLGQIMYNQTLQAINGNIEMPINLSKNCTDGMYWLVVTDNIRKYVIPLSIKK